MRDPGTTVRTAFIYLFQTASPVFVGSVQVPIVDGKLDQELLPSWDYYIVVTNQTAEIRQNKSRAATIEQIILELNHITQATADKATIEAMSDHVLKTVFPLTTLPGTSAIGLDPPFELTYCKLVNAETPQVVRLDGNRFLQRKILTFNNRIISN